MKTPLESITELCDMQRSSCDCVNDHYFRGMLNGLLIAKSCIDGISPEFQECPEHLKETKEYVNHGNPQPVSDTPS